MALKLPAILPIEVTSKCNLQCVFCLRTKEHLEHASNDIDDNLFIKKLLPLAKKIGAVLFIGYGEPFLNPNFINYLKIFSKEKIDVDVATNGLALSSTSINTLAKLKYLKIHFSIDTPNKVLYHELRGANISKVFENINLLIEKGFDSKNIIVASILLNKSIASLKDFPKILAKLKISNFMIQPYHEINLKSNNDTLHVINNLESHLNDIQLACHEFGIKLINGNIPRISAELNGIANLKLKFSPCNDKQTKNCTHAWNITHIDKNGMVYPCCYYAKSKYVLGDLSKNSFSEIWNGLAYQKFRDSLLRKKSTELFDICKRCDHIENIDIHPYNKVEILLKSQLKKTQFYKNMKRLKNELLSQLDKK